VFEVSVLRNTFGPGREEMTGAWGKVHNEERNDWNRLPGQGRAGIMRGGE
jgi:hypothetical protein